MRTHLDAFLEECAFRTIDASPEKLQRAVELSSPEQMRDLEKKQSANWVLTKDFQPPAFALRTKLL